MHWIVRTFRRVVIKVEVANFCAAMDTLIDQDDSTLGVAFHHLDSAFINSYMYIVKLLETWITLENLFSVYLNLLALQFLKSSKCIMLCYIHTC